MRHLSISIILLLSCFNIEAKEKIVNGYYVNSKEDTVFTKFIIPFKKGETLTDNIKKPKVENDDLYVSSTELKKKEIPDLLGLKNSVVVFDKAGWRNELKANEAKSFQIFSGKDTFTFVSVTLIDEKKNKSAAFMLSLVAGKVHLYQTSKKTGDPNGKEEEIFYIQKGYGPIFQYDDAFFHLSLAEYFPEYIDLKNLIEFSAFDTWDIISIINEYNKKPILLYFDESENAIYINTNTRLHLSDTIFSESFNYCFLISEGNKQAIVDSSMCSKNRNCLTEGLKTYFRNTSNLKFSNNQIQSDVNTSSEILRLFKYINSNSLTAMPPLNNIDKIFGKVSTDYILLSYSIGFTRTKENYRSNMIKGTFLGALTMGSVIYTPYESGSQLIAVLYNKRTRQVILCNKHTMNESKPDDQNEIDKLIETVFNPVFE